ncbi:zinc finger protein 853-like isoform X2 [Athalia rosae]|uniref:zinc finger protein 853-like isoform X2 n=1 Tax=Athalia rosae TaxID=37344 RepID=UPI002033A6A9|nr:zinc finger protein 853-like isoform X2 [Athalia rosae]
MSGYRRVNYYELCRLCTSSEGNKMNIFRDEGRRRQLQNKIQICLPVQVLEDDSLPKIVCHECVRKLENFFEFRETAVSAEGMLESYFTSLRFSEDFLKEGKVYVKTEEKKRSPTPEEEQAKFDKTASPPNTQIVVADEPVQHQQPVVVSNVNASNIHIISGVQARVQQYKCAMQPGGVAAAVVEATAETHYSYQQQTSQQVASQQQQSNQSQVQAQAQVNQQSNQNHQTQNQIQQAQNQIQNQNQINQQAQVQINHQNQRQMSQQNQSQIVQPNQTQISQQQNQTQISQQQSHSQINQQIQQLQRQQREFEKQQRHLQQIEKQQVQIAQQQEQQQTQIAQNQHQNNNIILKNESTPEQNQQVIQKVQSESQDNDTSNQNVQTYTTVQATPEIFLGLGFKEAPLAAQVARDDSKDFKDFIKVTSDDAISRNSIGQISEFLRIRTVPEPASLIAVNPQAVSQSSRNPSCRDCGKTFTTLNQLNNHSCSSSSLLNDVKDIKEEIAQTNGSQFSCDVCGKPFKRKEHLFQHRKLHTGERPYTCTACGKAFSRKEHLVRHSVSHTGQKMHECEMCGKSFSRKDNLHKHRKTHGVSGPYICDTCGKSFVVKHYYLMHLTTHAPTIDGLGCQDPLPYKCDQCHKAFSVKQYLTTHKLRHRYKNNANTNNSSNASVQQQSNTSTNNVSSSSNLNNGNGQTSNNTSVVQIQSVIEGNEQNGPFNGNQYHGNLQHFQ